ncbi:hypothetical protein [Niallia taxi]|uniref:hypothetical protein n=1 Tax=Niallia taxi TaxID=2499688 RepID=UPI0011A2FD54|nr:hypothetical protein [Niallia taxi]MCT2346644.1 hypothetical protein [Niallia taxi]MDE5054008.1 hypothetical protein [Niallia taxi]MED3963983.1 hypothetical protein [Niallia taxi]WOD63624.1 hypothetical protein NQZ71_04525 [Niallia taxi]
MSYPSNYPYYITNDQNPYRIGGGSFFPNPGPPSGPPPFQPGGPSGGPPPFQPGGPSFQPDFGGGSGGDQYGPPSGPPPSFVPQAQQLQGAQTFAIDPGAMRRCRFRYTYVWLRNGSSFWFYPTFIGRTSVAGWRWRNNRWVYYGTDADRIVSFQCT